MAITQKQSSKSKTQKILIVTAFPTHGAGSGALVTTQAKSYVDAGYEVVIITGNNRTDFEKLDGVRYHVVPFTAETEHPEIIEGQCPFNYLMFTTHTESTANFWNSSLEEIEIYMQAFRKAIKDEVTNFKPDIIHGQHNWISTSLATDFGIPVVLTIHGTDLMGYSKAKIKLESTKIEIDALKAEVANGKSSITPSMLDVIEKIYANSITKDAIMFEINSLVKNNDISKEDLAKVIDLYDSKTLFESYMYHAENSARNSEKIIVISDAQKNDFCSLFPNDASKVELIENGYDPKIFYVDNTVNKEEIIGSLVSHKTEDGKIDPNYDKLVLFVGKFADFKGIDSLLCSAKIYEEEMAKKGQTVLTLIVGSGSLDEKLKKQADKLGLKNTHFVGRKGHDVIRKLQNLADVSLIPSRNEPFGLVVIEGTACGHPVIATNSGGIPGILNVSKEKFSDLSKTYVTPLGVLVPALPERPENLQDNEKDYLDEISSEYIFREDDNEKKVLVAATSEKLNLEKTKVDSYLKSYSHSATSLGASVIRTLSNEISFDCAYIKDYTEKNYSQTVIRDKLISCFDEAIDLYSTKK